MHTNSYDYIKWGFESRLKQRQNNSRKKKNYIKWGFESRLKQYLQKVALLMIISNGDLRVD